ncbi:MAG: hypothetical protein ACR2RB_06515, partial [Gammaproteobacteria bacterium]
MCLFNGGLYHPLPTATPACEARGRGQGVEKSALLVRDRRLKIPGIFVQDFSGKVLKLAIRFVGWCVRRDKRGRRCQFF